MCFSKKINSQAIKHSFKQLYDARIAYTKQNQLSKFLICMLEYMQTILQSKIGYAVTSHGNLCNCLPCCPKAYNYRNVRQQFQKAYESCSNIEQLQYYRKFVNYMTYNTIKIPLEQGNNSLLDSQTKINKDIQNKETQIFFIVQVKGKITWSKQFSMILIPQRNCIVLKSSLNNQQTKINLRNYILRQSKHIKNNAFVICAIVPVTPQKLRFAISNMNQNQSKIIKKLKQLADKALRQNVNVWKQPVFHIQNKRLQKIQVKQSLTGLLQGKKMQQKPKQIIQEPIKMSSSTSIKNPLVNMMVDKAKIGLVKKAKQLQQQQSLSKQDNNKKSNNQYLSSIHNNTQKQPQHPKLLNNEKKDIKNMQKQNHNNLQYRNNRNSEIPSNTKTTNNILQQNAFKKKKGPKQILNQSEQQKSNCLKPKTIKNNYAQHPYQTRSQHGIGIRNQGDKGRTKIDLKNISKISQSKNQTQERPDSAKTLIDDLQKAVIFQQQDQFGNVSQLRSDYSSNNQSFQTIPDKKY